MSDYDNTDWVGYMHDLKYELRKLQQQVAELENEVRRLNQEREGNYEKWQVKCQQLKDGLTLATCYECGTRVHELSPRSRCCKCEYDRAIFNEKENNQLREQLG